MIIVTRQRIFIHFIIGNLPVYGETQYKNEELTYIKHYFT